MDKAEHKVAGKPDETLTFEKAKLELYKMAGGTVGRLTAEPGWRWSTHLKPVAKTEWCEAPHFQYHVSGVIRIRMSDGTELEPKSGDITYLPQGHDAWVVGDEPFVAIDWYGASKWGQPK
jgi:hypothetical protein